jgi:hypothetical protein
MLIEFTPVLERLRWVFPILHHLGCFDEVPLLDDCIDTMAA